MEVFSFSMPPATSTPRKSTKKSTLSHTPKAHRWSAKVDTDSTHPDPGLFAKGPRVIAHALASKKVSPKGPASGMRMLNFYINRAGKNLSAERVEVLQKAKKILSGIIERQKSEESSKAANPTSTSTKKSPIKKST